jgi:glutathione S-transferase
MFFSLFTIFFSFVAVAKSYKGIVRLTVSETCPYAARAWIACNEHLVKNDKVDFSLNIVNLQDKPQDFNDLYSSISPWQIGTSSKVPILEDNGLKMIESGIIASYVEEKYGSMLEVGAEDMAIARLFVDTFDKTLGGLTMQILKAAGDPVTTSAVVDSIRNSIKVLEVFFQKHSTNGPFVLSKKFTFAETMTAPFIQRLLPVAKHFLQVDVLLLCTEEKAPRLTEWIAATLERESVANIKVQDEQLVMAYDKMKARFASATAPKP